MKAILYRSRCSEDEAYISPNAGWNISVIDTDANSSTIRFLIEELVKSNNEIQLIDYTVHMDNTYDIDGMLNEVTLGMVERFYSLKNNATKGGDIDEAKLSHSGMNQPATRRLKSREEYEYSAYNVCSCGNPACDY